jgi:hypothetical protein
MRYRLQIYSGAAMAEYERLSADEQDAIVGEFRAISQSPGVIGGDQLQPADTATTVRVEDGQALLTDGPFLDAKEHLGGYYLVEESAQEAFALAAQRWPRHGTPPNPGAWLTITICRR